MTAEPLVPNPQYQKLQALFNQLKGEIGAIRVALDDANAKIASGEAWVGPWARTWGGDLSMKRGQLRSSADDLMDKVQSALKNCPEKVSPQAARSQLNPRY
ncbi:hypothetical protein [Actinomadura sp. DC4]|uniref:hypothetical protein n=1 Tax=Actinomadura sp. DC4 TaxID=3055069 RepID=UPI0025B06CBC|nr:hypothetical protein [Actinomadura sp. DC4]MDN3357077.1 hypothetical protein [Actinomadura sp. DC4]